MCSVAEKYFSKDGDDYNYEYADFSDQSATGRGTGQQSAYVPVAAFPDPPAIGNYTPLSFFLSET